MQITSRFTIAIHILGAIDYFHGKVPVNSTLLAQSIGANPVIVRGVMAKLSKAGYILASKGKNDITLKTSLNDITFYDIYQLVDDSAQKGLFHFQDVFVQRILVSGRFFLQSAATHIGRNVCNVSTQVML